MDNKPTILIVDDDSNLRKTLVDILKAKGFITIDVAQGKTALKKIKEHTPAVALIDLKLEDMFGLELMGEIKALSPITECIMITGHASQESAIEAVNLGAFSFIQKPYSIEKLLVIIRRAVEKQSMLEAMKAQYKGIPVPTYTWQWDGEDLMLINYNNAAMEITHGKVAGLLEIKASDMYHDTPEILEELLRCFNKKTSIQREMLYHYKSTGESKHLAVKYAFVPPNLVLVHTEDITERKQTDEALRESEEKYQSVVEDSPGAIDRFLPDGTITFVNQEYCKFFGKTYDELIGTKIQSLIPEEDREFVMSNIALLTEESPLRTFEHKVIRHDGEACWMRWTNRALFDKNGKITSYQSFGEDITERVQAEEALRKSEALLTETGRMARVGGWELDAKTLEVSWTEETYRIHKVPLGSKPPLEEAINFYHPDDRPKLETAIQKALERGEPYDLELRFITARGNHLWVHTTCKPITVDGKTAKLIGTFQDVTERKQAEEALRESEERFRSSFDYASIGITLIAPDGRFLKVNDSLCMIVGYSEAELLSTDFQTITHPDDLEADLDYVRQVLSSEIDTYQMEKRYIHKDGHVIWVLLSVSLVRNTEGEPIYFISQIQDITRRKHAELLLNTLNQAAITMGVAQSPQEIFDVVAKQLIELNIFSTIFLIDETQSKLITKYLSYDSTLLTAAEKLGGIDHKDFSFSIDAIDMYREVIREGKALFTDKPDPILKQMLPESVKKLSAQIIKLLHIPKNISAPLIVEGRVIGVFSIQSNTLTQEDIPIITAFADQLATTWNKVELLRNLKKTVNGTIHTIAATVEARDPYTAGHQTRVADLAVAIAAEMHLSKEQVEGIRMAGIIHDLGKIKVPAEILSKPGKISNLEYGIIKTHPQVGFDLLKEVDFPWPIDQMVLQHHEMIDGSGYPQGLKGDEILLDARVLTVADVVEAMASHRPYRPALGIEKALDQIMQEKGTQFDPVVVDACLKIFKQGYKLPEGQKIQLPD
jgi:PAS domain S-box-containing protein